MNLEDKQKNKDWRETSVTEHNRSGTKSRARESSERGGELDSQVLPPNIQRDKGADWGAPGIPGHLPSF